MDRTVIVGRSLILLLLLLFAGVVTAGDPMKGRAMYEDRCQGCHGAEGIPQVAGMANFKMGEGLMKPDQDLVSLVKKGKGVMPGFKGVLTDAEILDVIAHIRTFF